MKYADLSFDEQLEQLVRLINALKPAQLGDKGLAQIINLAREIPDSFVPESFPKLIAAKFGVDLKLVIEALRGGQNTTHGDFELLVPKGGWLHDYVEYTRNTEPPTAFHFFVGLNILGSTVQRRVYFPRGNGNIYPNLNIVLVAPAGKCKKTTACNLGVNLFRKVGGNVLADKITPEAIIESFQSQPTAAGLLYAPEWAVFLGKQQYLEGLVPMLTALFDCPDVWSSQTLMRGQTQLVDVFLSHLAATTIDWMQSSVTKDAFAGGFMSRLLFVVQKDTPRSFPLPPPLDKSLEKSLTNTLVRLQHAKGEISLTPEAESWYRLWYTARQNQTVDKHFAGYYERKPDRLLQIAMLLNMSADPSNFVLTKETLELSEKLLLWIEYYLPATFEELTTSVVGDDQLRLLRQLRNAKNQELGYSEWLRKNTSRMDTTAFRKYTETLVGAGMVAVDRDKRRYYLLPAGKAAL